MIDQSFHRPAADEVLVKDSICVFNLDVAVPNVLGVDNDHGSMPALIHTPRVIDANRSLEPGLGDELFQAGVHGFRVAVYGTCAPRRTHKHVLLKRTHSDEYPEYHSERSVKIRNYSTDWSLNCQGGKAQR